MACVFSKGLEYRYTLTRSVDLTGTGTLAFIMLNPSTADDEKDDATIRRCCGFARSLGYSELQVVNLFAWRSTDPYGLLRVADPVGPSNDRWITHVCTGAQRVICAWGSFAQAEERSRQVLGLLRQLGVTPHALRLTRSGQPAHPLRLPGNLRPFPLSEGPSFRWESATHRDQR